MEGENGYELISSWLFASAAYITRIYSSLFCYRRKAVAVAGRFQLPASVSQGQIYRD